LLLNKILGRLSYYVVIKKLGLLMSAEDIKRQTIEFIMVDMLALPLMKEGEADEQYMARLDHKGRAAFYLWTEFEEFSQNPERYLGHPAQYTNDELAIETSYLSKINAELQGQPIFEDAMSRLASFKVMKEFFDKAKERIDSSANGPLFQDRGLALQVEILGFGLSSAKQKYCCIDDNYGGEPQLPKFEQEFVARSFQRQMLPQTRL
jgi:hypothetical protein